MAGRFDGCIAYIYDTEGNLLTTTKILEHDRTGNSVEVEMSQILLDNQRCEMFILAPPVPYACMGVVHPHGAYLTIKMFRGQAKENRSVARYNITGKALITAYICDEVKYALHSPIEAELLNISTSGVRLRTRYNQLSENDSFDFHMKIGDNLKTLTAEVINSNDINEEYSEYGCVFKGKADE